MKVFFSTLSAILVAAVIIGLVLAALASWLWYLKWDAEGRQIKYDTESRQAFSEWSEQVANNPRTAPSSEKLTARLQEIREAIDNGKPIPPSHWQTETTPVVQQPAPQIEPPASEFVTLNRDVEVTHGVRKVVIPAGSKLPVVSRGSRVVGVRFADELQIVPESATSTSK